MILATLIYCLRDNKLLLLRRRKPPFVGHWLAPGGKLEAHEAPISCAARELREETGLLAKHLQLRAMITEISPRPDYQWLVFAYLAENVEGELITDEREGELRWWSLDELNDLLMPESDRIFLPRVLDTTTPLYEATYCYDAELNLVETFEGSTDNARLTITKST